MTDAEERAWRDGYLAGRVAERMGIGTVEPQDSHAAIDRLFPNTTPDDFPRPMSVREAERPKLRLIATDTDTSNLFHLPTNDNSAA